MLDTLLKPEKERFPDEDVFNHAVSSVLCYLDKTAGYPIKATLSICFAFNYQADDRSSQQ
jgi:hypothetical protein